MEPIELVAEDVHLEGQAKFPERASRGTMRPIEVRPSLEGQAVDEDLGLIVIDPDGSEVGRDGEVAVSAGRELAPEGGGRVAEKAERMAVGLVDDRRGVGSRE